MGSPPQVRGKPPPFGEIRRYRRITPAGAGKTLDFAAKRAFCWDHPRRCGENVLHTDCKDKFLGSPPQVRGKQSVIVIHGAESGITPAGAGKT